MRTAQTDSPTRTRLLDAAQKLMLAKGFAATTVDDICEAAKLTKGSFFHYFESKEHLGRVLLERFCDATTGRLDGLCGKERDPLKWVHNYIETIAKLSQDPHANQGCLLGCFAQELSDTHPTIRAICEERFDRWAQQFGGALTQAKRRYAPRASFNPQELAEHFIAVLEGSLILGKARQDMKVVATNLRHFQAYLKNLFQR